jgi:hypothetical protein
VLLLPHQQDACARPRCSSMRRTIVNASSDSLLLPHQLRAATVLLFTRALCATAATGRLRATAVPVLTSLTVATTPTGRLRAAAVLFYAANIAAALAHCHGRGVAHRDLKASAS